MWSFHKVEKIKNTTKYRANTFGFYTINGNSVIRFYENSRKEDVCSFLEAIRAYNTGKSIVLILDNFASHRSKMVNEKALDLHTPRSQSHRIPVEVCETHCFQNSDRIRNASEGCI